MRVDVVKSRSSVRRGCDELLSSIVKAHVQGFIAVTGECADTLAWMGAGLVTRGAGLVIGGGLFWDRRGFLRDGLVVDVGGACFWEVCILLEGRH